MSPGLRCLISRRVREWNRGLRSGYIDRVARFAPLSEPEADEAQPYVLWCLQTSHLSIALIIDTAWSIIVLPETQPMVRTSLPKKPRSSIAW